MKLAGASLILIGCCGFGASLVRAYRQEETMIRMLLYALEWMERQLRYQLTPLPELFRQTAYQTSGALRRVLLEMARVLEAQTAADAAGCAALVLKQSTGIPPKTKELLHLLGSSIGCFDLSGQLEGLKSVQAACAEMLDFLKSGREQRLRSYQTLSLCAGAALVILFI